jgi:hypothetical protein
MDEEDFKRLLLSLPDRPKRDLMAELPLVYTVPIVSLSRERRLHFYETNQILKDNPQLGMFIAIKFNSTPTLVDGNITPSYTLSYEARLPNQPATPENLMQAINGIEACAEAHINYCEEVRRRAI